MVVGEPKRNIMEGIKNTGDVHLHDHRLRLKQRFDIIRKLGQGAYGKVQLGINKKTSQEVAIKTIKKCKIETEADLIRLRREVQIMSSVRHPNIVHIYEVFENSEKMILVMEYCAGGELYNYLSQQKVLQEDEARRLFRQIATAVYYCHKHKICHRDLKLENVLLDEHGNAKIADFGLSNVFEERRLLSTFCGSPLYASPEIVKGTPYIGPEVDCWSLGVVLYTLVYGAMPFDGSIFKRLVKQISIGAYFEPKNPSSASPLIRDMLTVDPIQRADITHICDDPWVNKGSDVSCLELAEALANETPVRLDLLLSLAPPPQHGSDKLVVINEATNSGPDCAPGHSMSMSNVDASAERRILEMVAEGGTDAIKPSPTRTIVGAEQPKRKFETSVSMENAACQRKKERFVRSNSKISQDPLQVEEDTELPSPIENNVQPADIQRDESMTQDTKSELRAEVPKEKSLSKEHLEEAREPPAKAPVAKAPSPTKIPPPVIEAPVSQTVPPIQTKTPVIAKKDIKSDPKPKDSLIKEKNSATKTSVVKKKIVSPSSKESKDEKKSIKPKEKSPLRKSIEKDSSPIKKAAEDEGTKAEPVAVKQPTEKRRSRILDTAEKLNNLTIQPAPATVPPPLPLASPPPVKPKKVLIPGVSVGSFKEQFERRASLTSGAPPVVESKKTPSKTVQAVVTPSGKSFAEKRMHSVDSEHPSTVNNKEPTNIKLQTIGVEPPPQENVIIPVAELSKKFSPPEVTTNKLTKPLHKSESLKEPSPRKDQLHSSLSLEDARRSLQQSMALLTQAKNDYHQSKSVEDNSSGGKPPVPYGSGGRSASGSLSLGSQGGSPPTSPPHAPTPPRTFVTEVQHRVDDVRNKFLPTSRGGSVERIIPIQFSGEAPKIQNSSNTHTQLPYQRNKTMPYRLSSIPRGNVSQSEVEKEPKPFSPPASAEIRSAEPIKKSPREFIIPIAVEGVGYVTPRQGSLEPSETPTKMPSSNMSYSSRFPKPRRLSSLVSGGESEDEDDMHMHRLRSSRRVRADAEKDSVSSGEEDDDEGFELLTAENLFLTLLDSVRNVAKRLNGEQGAGFPQHHQSLFNNLHSPFFNRREGPSWRRSTSRDIASDFDSMFPSHTTFPRGSRRRSRKTALAKGESPLDPPAGSNGSGSLAPLAPHPASHASGDTLDLSHLDLSKMELSEKEVEALSSLTPALSRRLQRQLLAHLPPAAVRSLRRTLSAHLPASAPTPPPPFTRSLSGSSPPRNPPRNVSQEDEDESSISCSSLLTDLNKDKSSAQSPECTSCEPSESLWLKNDHSSNSIDTLTGRYDSSHSTESITPRLASRTPDQSVLSKYFSDKVPEEYSCTRNSYKRGGALAEPSYGTSYGAGCSLSGIPMGGSLRRHSLRTPPADTSRRRVSRFLRPDFFDTPREESLYVRDKKEKELETQEVLKEIRQKKNRSTDTSLSSPCSPLTSVDIANLFDASNTRAAYRNSLSPVGLPISRDKSRSVTPFYPILDNITEYRSDQVTEAPRKNVSVTAEKEIDSCSPVSKHNLSKNQASDQYVSSSTANEKSSVTTTDSRLVRPKSYPAKSNEKNDIQPLMKANKKSESAHNNSTDSFSSENSRILRPKSYPNSSTSPEKTFSLIPPKESVEHEPKLVVKQQPVVMNSTPLENGSHESDQNISVSFNVCLPTKNSEKLNSFTSKISKEDNNMTLKLEPKSETKTPIRVLKSADYINGNTHIILEPESSRSENVITNSNVEEINSLLINKSEDIKENEISKVDTPTPEIIDNLEIQKCDDTNNIPVFIKPPIQAEKSTTEEKKKKTLVKKKIVTKKKVVAKKSDALVENQVKNTEDQKVEGKEPIQSKLSNPEEKITPLKKKSVLHSIGEKFEKFRNDSFNRGCSQEKEKASLESGSKGGQTKLQTPVAKDEPKVSRIENVMRALRERSVPSNNSVSEPPTESSLIKRAVTITDLPMLDVKVAPSKKSVNRVLGLFKKIESKDKIVKTAPEILGNEASSQEESPKVENLKSENIISQPKSENQISESNKPKRPTSLLLNGIGKRVQACYNGANSDSVLVKDLNSNCEDEPKTQKKGLRLDFSRLPRLNQGIFNKRNSLDLSKSREGSECKEMDSKISENEISPKMIIADESQNVVNGNEFINNNGNSNEASSNILTSPNWSPDYDTRKFMIDPEPDYNQNSQPPQRSFDAVMPDSDNIIDRIRRKSFYSRFNEKKNRRKSQLVGPGVKEYNPSERIHTPIDGDNGFQTKFDHSPVGNKYERPQTSELSKLSHYSDNGEGSSPTRFRPSTSYSGDLPSVSHKSLDRSERKYLLDPQYSHYPENNAHYSTPRYTRTVSLFDNLDTSQPTDYKNSSSRYGRSFSLLSPTYSTLGSRTHSRNSAILLRDSGDVEPYTENVLSKIRNRKKLAMSPTMDDEDTYLDTKIRSNHPSTTEHDKSADRAE